MERVASRQVFELYRNGITVYEDVEHTFHLVVSKKTRRITASLSVLQDGANSFSQDGLGCTERSVISYRRKKIE